MKILTVVGARPQFIKAYPVCMALQRAGHKEFIVHTGQHYDHQMSRVFFDEMGIPKPDANLGVGSGSHGKQTGEMLAQIEQILLSEKPDWVLVYGDTNSTLAGALAAVKLHIPVAHVEAGLRSFNREMPEEHNRVLTDHCAQLLFCPTQTAIDNLANEGIKKGVHLVGDTMYDAVLTFYEIAREKSSILEKTNINPKEYILATLHRPYNTDEPDNLHNILNAFGALEKPVIFPTHPRTLQKIEELALDIEALCPNVHFISPVGYLDMLVLEKNAEVILTDSGGIQKEAYFFDVPCVTMRPETEWVETVSGGWNILVGANREKIIAAVNDKSWYQQKRGDLFGDGNAAEKIVALF